MLFLWLATGAALHLAVSLAMLVILGIALALAFSLPSWQGRSGSFGQPALWTVQSYPMLAYPMLAYPTPAYPTLAYITSRGW